MTRLVSLSIIFLSVWVITLPVIGADYLVKPDGTGDFLSIQVAINFAKTGDTVWLTDGTFKGLGNRNINFMGKAISVRSQSGRPELCVIDAEGVPYIPNRGFDFRMKEGNDSVVRDITIKHGATADC